MNLTRRTYTTRSEKVVDFILGFVGWIVLNLVIGGLLALGSNLLVTTPLGTDPNVQTIFGTISLVCNCLILIANIGLIVYFALTRYWIALGALGAFATLLVIAICAAVIFGAVCFTALSQTQP